MNIRKKHREGAEVATESLNDIMFFLLLFFLIVSTLVNPNVIKLILPSASQAQQMAKQQITLSVTKEREFFVNKKPIAFEDLENVLEGEAAKATEPTVVLRMHKDLTIQDLADIQQICARLKLKMVMATDAKK